MIDSIKSKLRLKAGQLIISLFEWGVRRDLIIGYFVNPVPREEIRETSESIAERLGNTFTNPQPTIVLRYTGDEDNPFDAFEVEPCV